MIRFILVFLLSNLIGGFTYAAWQNQSLDRFTFWRQSQKIPTPTAVVFPNQQLSELKQVGYLQDKNEFGMILENPEGEMLLLKPNDLVTEEQLLVKSISEKNFYYSDQNGAVHVKKF